MPTNILLAHLLDPHVLHVLPVYIESIFRRHTSL